MRTTKTSETHPLHLAAVTPAHGRGRILFFMCPGKVQPSAVTGPWNRDLDVDMNAIANAGATALLTLMDDEELQSCALSGDQLNTACEQRGMIWLQAPIVDFHAPDDDWEKCWIEIGKTLREQLHSGSTIAIHCRGGRGRAGMVAAKLLVELGTPPDEAIDQVRAERPEAIETAVQAAHVRACGAGTLA